MEEEEGDRARGLPYMRSALDGGSQTRLFMGSPISAVAWPKVNSLSSSFYPRPSSGAPVAKKKQTTKTMETSSVAMVRKSKIVVDVSYGSPQRAMLSRMRDYFCLDITLSFRGVSASFSVQANAMIAMNDAQITLSTLCHTPQSFTKCSISHFAFLQPRTLARCSDYVKHVPINDVQGGPIGFYTGS